MDVVHYGTGNKPGTAGFEKEVAQSTITRLWDRKSDGGFPGKTNIFFWQMLPTQRVHALSPGPIVTPLANSVDKETKELKRRLRDVIDPGRDLGHVDGKKTATSSEKVEIAKAGRLPEQEQQEKTGMDEAKQQSLGSRACEDCT